jgi:glycerol-3-phosphate O-acyltransferase
MNSLLEKPFYPCVLDHKPGFFLGWFFYTLFKRFRFDAHRVEELKEMHRRGTVVYAIKYRAGLDYLLYHYRFRKSRLPYPKIAFGLNMSWFMPLARLTRVLRFQLGHFIRQGSFPDPFETGFFREALRNRTTSLLSLIDPKGFAEQFIYAKKNALSFLVETQKEMDKPIYIVPQFVIYGTTPEKEYTRLMDIFFGFRDKHGVIRKIGLFLRHHNRAFIDFGRPLDLKAYLETQPHDRPLEALTAEIRQMLIESIDAQKRVVLGPIMKSRQQLKEKVLGDDRVTKGLQRLAGGDRNRLTQIKKKAGDHFDEIAADYNVAYIQFFHRALTWLWKKIYEGIDVVPEQLAVVRDWARRGPVIYVPSHKSHIDYLVLNYVLYLDNMHVPRIAAGKNLTFWPMGHAFRKSGAFFIRRSFRGDRLYALVFERYVKALLEEGHPLEFFIEGGRSRSGKLILPKLGFLSILLNAQAEGYAKDLIFVPASITYDRILEEKSYLKEVGGDSKKQENFWEILKARHFLNRKHGRIYIRFGQPLSLTEYLEQGERPAEAALEDLAFHIIRAINKVTLVTPLALVATALLSKHRKGFTLQELTESAGAILDFLKNRGALLSASLDPLESAVEETVAHLTRAKVVRHLEELDGEETFYYVEDDEKPELEYYKNSILHFFIPYAFVAVSLLTGPEEWIDDEKIFSDYTFMKSLFKDEFIYEQLGDVTQEIQEAAALFEKAGFIRRNEKEGGYRVTRSGFAELPAWAALVRTFLESYYIVVRSLTQAKARRPKDADLLKYTTHLGLRYQKTGLIEHREAINQINFKNAQRRIQKETAVTRGRDTDTKREKRRALSHLGQRLYDLSHFRY